jgi:hypothetical protein
MCFRRRARVRWLKTCRSLLRYSGSTPCSIRFGTIRVSEALRSKTKVISLGAVLTNEQLIRTHFTGSITRRNGNRWKSVSLV